MGWRECASCVVVLDKTVGGLFPGRDERGRRKPLLAGVLVRPAQAPSISPIGPRKHKQTNKQKVKQKNTMAGPEQGLRAGVSPSQRSRYVRRCAGAESWSYCRYLSAAVVAAAAAGTTTGPKQPRLELGLRLPSGAPARRTQRRKRGFQSGNRRA
ncbi:hypothetical protein BDY21DRAFT_158938 [Lineolata rhizophorae]|uniref:Uncharacterized protein n=1 Tax=Lineolata rhizophorae TaxID=578093 RepID=A0A6A6NMP1_9PEZI|nr:hypothetical protein BDY21DRAFT_158938 [Lineolata rhizophorae]